MKNIVYIIIILLLTSTVFADEQLLIFAGSASMPALEEINHNFEAEHRVKVKISFGGSGNVLSQIKLGKKGDIYIPGSSDFMEKAKEERLVLPETEEKIAYLIPSICVVPDNPKSINSLESLVEKDVRLGIANPETVCVGLYAVEIIEKSGLTEKIRKNCYLC